MSDDRPDDAAADLLDLLAGKWRAQAASTAAALGLPDHLTDEPRDVDALAAAVGARPDPLRRLLRTLAGLGLCEERPGQGFVRTTLGDTLRTDSLGPLAAFIGAPEQWDPWSRLRDALRGDDAVAFEIAHGEGLYEHLAHQEEAARRYDAAVDAFTRHEAAALAEAFDFGAVKTVVDVGGGRGTLLRTLLERWPALQGVLFDLPHVAARTESALRGPLGDRIEVVGGDFRQEIPPGGDVYVLKHVLHNWSDEDSAEILRRTAAAMNDAGRLLAIEGILLPGPVADTTSFLDLEMLVLTGGRERRKPELKRLFASAGLRVERVERLTGMGYLIEARVR